jgi:ribosomal protein L37AE/L43A
LTTRRKHACPVCGQHTLSERGAYEICSVCGWEDDPAQLADPDLAGGANRESLNQARANSRRKQQT